MTGSRTAPVAAILLAAGLSTRMGRSKPLLPWDGRTLVEFQVAELRAAGVADVVVVTGHQADAVEAALRGAEARTVFNPDYRSGRATSVRAGADALQKRATAVVVLSVDQPRPAAVTRALIQALRESRAPVCVPTYGGRRGHPAVFAGALIPELAAVSEEGEGLRAVMRAHAAEVLEVPMDDPRVLVDANTPEGYHQTLALFGLAPGRVVEG